MCNCIEKYRKQIIADFEKQGTPAQYVRFELSTIHSQGMKNLITGQAIEIGYQKANKKGELQRKTEKSFVSHNYCPWCGKKYV
ncbi:hypothetical protein CAP35_13910 [Chitinophagaceae bacterium IBVUCB1]|nr:hypothetical protein CAP35_13910 [Chitinophagaceae bacterium IBVUCB1]